MCATRGAQIQRERRSVHKQVAQHVLHRSRRVRLVVSRGTRIWAANTGVHPSLAILLGRLLGSTLFLTCSVLTVAQPLSVTVQQSN